MRFFAIILLFALLAGSVPAFAGICCEKEKPCHSDSQKEKSSKVSCANCIHHDHAKNTNFSFSYVTVTKVIVQNQLVVENLISDIQYPLLEPPSHS